MMLRERISADDEQESGWLETEAVTPLKILIKTLATGYTPELMPTHIEEAIRKLQDAADDIWRRQCALDNGDAA